MQVLDQSFKLYRKAFWPSLPLSLFISIGIYAPFLFFKHQNASELWVQLFSLNVSVLYMWLIWLLTFVGSCALIVKINSVYLESELSLPACVKAAFFDVVPLISVALIYAIIVICGTVILIVPGIILSVSLMFALIIRLVDHRDIFDSISISHQLVWGNWWYTAFVISIPFLMNTVLFFAVFISVVGILTNFTSTWDQAYFFSFFLNTLLQVIFLPLIVGTALCLFYDLKAKMLAKKTS